MIISVWSKKGGVGKTSIAYNLARDLDYFLISNDDSIIEKAYPNMSKILDSKHLKLIDNCIYDFGGFVDAHIKDILQKSDLVIVPTNSDLNSFKKTLSTIKELKELGQNKIIIIANKVDSSDDFIEIENFFKNQNLNVLELSNSKIFKKSFELQKSISDICNNSKLNAYIYRNICKKWSELLNLIKGVQNG